MTPVDEIFARGESATTYSVISYANTGVVKLKVNDAGEPSWSEE